ncbi:MAG: prepilin-type N-terminal cleavage/methylation domain-containing protein [Pirellulales bacterium]
MIFSRPSLDHRLASALRCRYLHRGITLVEMLVALAVTLLMMGAVITVFGFIGERVTDSRGLIETNDRLRSAAHRLREDLKSVTVDAIPWRRPEAGQGYLEILEGPLRDYALDASGNVSVIPGGDTDDLLMFTVRSEGEPYRGKVPTSNFAPSGTMESNTVEVVWYMRPTLDVVTNPPTYSLCRRQMLVVPVETPLAAAPVDATFFELYDVSARVDRVGNGVGRVANTLGDLTKRENRFLHNRHYANGLTNSAAAFGYPWRPRYQLNVPPVPPFSDLRRGEEVVLTNVLSFNVQVFDPRVAIKANTISAFEPGDPAYRNMSAGNSLARGAYMDLGDSVVGAIFGIIPSTSDAARKSLLSPSPGSQFLYSTYDTWSFHYEHDGIRQPGAQLPGIDTGTNGLDDNSGASPGVDDMSERETSPPYPYPLRGLRVNIRVYEPGSKQLREVTVVQSFVPE